MIEKICSLSDAVRDLVRDGDGVVIGASLETAIPFAATYEIIRQGKKNLEMIAPISDASTDMLIGAGCVGAVTGAWVGNVSGGLGHNYRRAAEKQIPHALDINDYSNFTIGMALFAGAYGLPYAPVRSILGSDIINSNPAFKMATNPFSTETEPVVLVPPVKPDVAILGVQRADAAGNNHYWGSSGLAQEAALAAERVIIVADEIVEPDVISSDPSRVLVPGFRVAAVCHVPAGTHPAPLTGRWQRDSAFFNEYHARSRDVDGYKAWLDEWVFAVEGAPGYAKKLGDRLSALKIAGSQNAAHANYAAE